MHLTTAGLPGFLLYSILVRLASPYKVGMQHSRLSYPQIESAWHGHFELSEEFCLENTV